MAFQPAPRCAEAVLSFAGNSAAWKHVLNFQYPTTYGTEQISDLATVVSTLAGAQLRPLVEAESWKFVVLSRFNAGAKRASAIAFEVVVSQRRNAAIDSQRGRLQPGH